jgi:hypothetical protein
VHFGEKILPKYCPVYSLQDDGILYSQGAVIQRAIYVSPAFLKHNYAEKKMQAHAKTIIRTCKNHYPNMQKP